MRERQRGVHGRETYPDEKKTNKIKQTRSKQSAAMLNVFPLRARRVSIFLLFFPSAHCINNEISTVYKFPSAAARVRMI